MSVFQDLIVKHKAGIGNLFVCETETGESNMTPWQALGFSEQRGYTLRIPDAEVQAEFDKALKERREAKARMRDSGDLDYQTRFDMLLAEQQALQRQRKLGVGPVKVSHETYQPLHEADYEQA